ncbi:helicase [bacterium (Candidatus Blackallbacteria) CG17_big_fil_post_rev_8_21_14_2_50_48_46]|uniref:Helicase n=1 Tax=bacterium (Candidatus Blackallbacteria) CG17_big_fil_post_rev_8_21_14_2_50_48_46 TaxID=2014261 RepID=A0A2M7FYT9_9BACT|nr:MAG: helicase [bacterium (Candidatus Blackallbacteria) CG18_big_fil_WC_8_21_14_2_50_49_26]PIW14540.1 MAG: helicase [bacterium (Candidatus Blackallbacteria) CG17_big_fil_post_rev_8_21_14_2_50_48_46]PIW47225.1 MAG: helicase [bacterium (Candidatus Blackallbacteria) CG13_big_fil_rev_8_21_14_2_50_49_14]
MENEIDIILNKEKVKKRTLSYGGLDKEELLSKLRSNNILLNEYAQVLFSSDLYKTSPISQNTTIIELSIGDLGFTQGAIFREIFNKCEKIGLKPCELDMGPYLRLEYLQQEEVIEPGKNKAPKGSLTLFSKPLREQNDDFPKGFYIRKMDEKLWLRGYICPMDYVWDPDTRIVLRL